MMLNYLLRRLRGGRAAMKSLLPINLEASVQQVVFWNTYHKLRCSMNRGCALGRDDPATCSVCLRDGST